MTSRGGEGTSTGRRLHLVVDDLLAHLSQVFLGEDETDVALDVRQQLLQGRVVVQVSADGLADHGVLAHEQDGVLAERNTDRLHLLRADIVDAHDEALWGTRRAAAPVAGSSCSSRSSYPP
ncbi:hypothetical protein MRX96_042768 [Rhipicephalus microplus]